MANRQDWFWASGGVGRRWLPAVAALVCFASISNAQPPAARAPSTVRPASAPPAKREAEDWQVFFSDGANVPRGPLLPMVVGGAVRGVARFEPPPARLPDAIGPRPEAPPGDPLPLPTPLTVEGQPVDVDALRKLVLTGGCASCGGDGCGVCGLPKNCVPGEANCEPFPATTRAERLVATLYECICCPDHCYVPQWTSLANAAFFVDGARPTIMTRIRYDGGWNFRTPDRAEYYWARADGQGLGPKPNPPLKGVRSADIMDASLYTEAGTGRIAVVSIMPYRSVHSPDASTGSGFGDMAIGTKTLLYDCELFQFAFRFLTYMPTGSARKGVGTGHVSLEWAGLVALNVAPDTVFQAEVAQVAPISADSDFAGSLLHWHFALNRVCWKPVTRVQLIGTLELNGWSFQDGGYSDPVLGVQKANNATYLSLGTGWRLAFCDQVDFGVAGALALTRQHWAREQLRIEFRYRY